MEAQSIRLRLVFEDHSALSEAQRLEGMSRSWVLIEPHIHRKITDVCNHLLHIFNLRSSCPNGILLSMEGFVLPSSESTQILKDKEIICVRKKGMALNEAIEAGDACNLLNNGEDNRREPIDNGMLLLENEEFAKEIGGYQSESEVDEDEKLEEPLPKEKVTKKRKACTKLSSSKKKKHRSAMMDGIEDEVAADEDEVNSDECLPMKIMSKKNKQNKKDCAEAESLILKVKSPPKVKRKKHLSGVLNGAEDEVVNADSGQSLLTKMNSKKNKRKKNKPKEEINKGNVEMSEEKVEPFPDVKRSKHLPDTINGVEQASTAPDGVKKVPSRSARRKKAKRQLWRELAKISKENEIQPEVSNAGNKEVNDHPNGHDQVPTKVVHKSTIQQEERNHNGNVHTELVPCVVRPGHIRFEPLDEDEDEYEKQIDVPNVAFQWNGITTKKKGQKWGIEKYSTNQRDDSHKASREPLMMMSADTEVPEVDLNDFDKLPLCSSPKEGDVIAYRLLELSSSWTPELSSFRVGKISHYDGNNIILMPVPQYPIVLDKIEEGGPDNSLYGEDGSLEIKFTALVDVRSVKQCNSKAMQAVSNGGKQPAGCDDMALMCISQDPRPEAEAEAEVTNLWDEVKEAISAKKSELLELNEEKTKDSGSGSYRWSYRALRGSALGPTMAMLRSRNDI